MASNENVTTVVSIDDDACYWSDEEHDWEHESD
jgi:hypothetical protein